MVWGGGRIEGGVVGDGSWAVDILPGKRGRMQGKKKKSWDSQPIY